MIKVVFMKNNILQGVIAAVLGAFIMGIFAYAFVVRENQILITVLDRKLQGLENEFKEKNKEIQGIALKNKDEIGAVKLMLAGSFPKYPLSSETNFGEVIEKEISPVEAALLVKASELANRLNENYKLPYDKDSEELLFDIYSQYQRILIMAKTTNPNIASDIQGILENRPNPYGPKNEVEKAHRDLVNIIQNNDNAMKKNDMEITSSNEVTVKDIDTIFEGDRKRSKISIISGDLGGLLGLEK